MKYLGRNNDGKDLAIQEEVAQLQAVVERMKRLTFDDAGVRPPMGYAISEPILGEGDGHYLIYFDNGASLKLPINKGLPVQETGGLLGIGQPGAFGGATNATTTLAAAPLTYAIMRTATRSVQSNTWKLANGVAQWYREPLEVVNPVRDPEDYDWSEARYNPDDTSAVSLGNQPNLIRTFYALGIWGRSTVEGFGAKKS